MTGSMAEKFCFKCGIKKPLTEFYKHDRMYDGYLNKCKECTKTDVHKNYRDNIDDKKDYEKNVILPKNEKMPQHKNKENIEPEIQKNTKLELLLGMHYVTVN